MNEKAIMHRQEDVETDLEGHRLISDELLFRWYNDSYSTSKHLLALYSVARGLRARSVVEVGFGRSTFVLARAAAENEGRFVTCDNRDFQYLLSTEERSVTDYKLGFSDLVWSDETLNRVGIDMAFLDYFSSEDVDPQFVKSELKRCIALLKTNAVIAVHDVFVDKYSVGKALRSLCRWNRHLEYSVLPYNYGLGLIRYTGPSKYGMISESWTKQ
jgi:predicted O-methyltransferase YrrM